jgi:predicted RNA-binding Zn ribbon-like protein
MVKLSGDLVTFQSDAALISISYTDFTSNTPRVDDPATAGFDESTTGYGAYGFAKGANAPLQAMGYRINFAQTTPGTVQSMTGRLAFELQDQASVAQREILRIEIDKITASVDINDQLTFTAAPDATVYVYAKNSAGLSATVNAPATAALIKQTAVTGDPTSTDMLLDVNAAVTAALAAASGTQAAVLNTVKDFAAGVEAPFEVALTLSNVNMVLGSNTATALVGKTITVDGSGLPGVTGGGIAKGYLQVQ